jgi:signal recognition particle subunit SEC65
MTLRQTVSNLMVAIHLVKPELASEWAAKMDDAELRRRFRMYARQLKVSGPVSREAEGAIGNLTINGMGSGPEFAHAGSKEFPRREPEREGRI